MLVYAEKPRFNVNTGKSAGTCKVPVRCLCDVCGEILEVLEDDGCQPELTIVVDYGGMDPCFGSGNREYRFGRKYGINVGVFLSSPFMSHNLYNESDIPCDKVLAEEIKLTGSLADAIRSLKLQTAERLIESGTLNPGELDGN